MIMMNAQSVAPPASLSITFPIKHCDPARIVTMNGGRISTNPLKLQKRNPMPKNKYEVFDDVPYYGHMRFRLGLVDPEGKMVINSTICYSSSRETLEAIKLALEFTANSIKAADAMQNKALKGHYAIYGTLFPEEE
jgi:hypothetical protein